MEKTNIQARLFATAVNGCCVLGEMSVTCSLLLFTSKRNSLQKFKLFEDSHSFEFP